MDKIAIGIRLREARLNKGYTQQALADQADIGIVYISEIERGIKMPSINTFIRIIEALDVSADYVLRDRLTIGKQYLNNEITEKLNGLSPQQRKTIMDILDAYIKNLP